jgi:hypothetical protein
LDNVLVPASISGFGHGTTFSGAGDVIVSPQYGHGELVAGKSHGIKMRPRQQGQ